MKVSRTGLAAIIVLLAEATSAVGQAQQVPVLTLRQAIGIAMRQSPQGAAAKAEEKATGAQVAATRSALFPRLTFTENISRGDDPVYVFGTRLRQRQFSEQDFALGALNRPAPTGNFASRLDGEWTLFDWFGTARRIREARLASESAGSMVEAANQAIVLRVVEGYQAELYAERREDLARHELATARKLRKDARTKVKAGLAVDSDLLEAEVNVAEREEERVAAEGEVDASWAGLEAAMGTTISPRPALQPLRARSFSSGVLSEAITSALKARPDLRALDERSKASQAGVGAAKSAFGPRLSAYGDWEMDRRTFAGTGGDNWVAGVELKIDLLPLAGRAQLKEQEAEHNRSQAKERERADEIRLAVTQAWTAQRADERIVSTSEAAAAQAAESLRILRNRYNAGLATMTDLLRSEDAGRRSRNDYWRAVYGNTVSYAELLYVTGRLTPAAAEGLE